MKSIILYTLLVISLLHAHAQELADPYKKIDYFVLDNGMQVYLLSDERSTNTQISIKVNVGWDIEEEKTYGLSHLVEHMVFRDQKVPYHDYLDYMKEEGASYVNGYTRRYTTEYVATIKSEKSYWITELFSQMLFDKNVTTEDLEVERGALQVEIGEVKWYDGLYDIFYFLNKIGPPHETIYTNHFGIKKLKELPNFMIQKSNNKLFTYEDVMKHYETYYYPKNMILKVAGNFDLSKMKKLINTKYGKVKKTGEHRTHQPPRDATLNNKPYYEYLEGGGDNMGYIGTKYLFDDCQKNIILNSFMNYVATKIQQNLRNKQGKSYSIYASEFNSRGAGIIAITFDGLREDFEKNIKLVEENIKKYVKNLDDKMISEALKEYKKRYTSMEFDSNSLINRINRAEHMRSDHNITDKTHFEFFNTIEPNIFKKVVKETFIPNNHYSHIQRNYYYFANDNTIIQLLFFLLFLWLYFKYNTLLLSYRGISYNKRNVIFSQRLSNRFIGFMIFIFIYLVSQLTYAWCEYLVMKYIVGDVQYLFTLDVPYSYMATIISLVIHILFFFLFYRYFSNYYSSLVITEDRLNIWGNNPMVINKDEIDTIKVSPWSPLHFFKIKGWSFLFWKPLVEVQTKNGIFFLRAGNAKELKEDLERKWLNI